MNEDILDYYNIEIYDKDVLYIGFICDYTWCDTLIIFTQNNIYYVNDDCDNWEPYEVSEEEANQRMKEFDLAIEENNFTY